MTDRYVANLVIMCTGKVRRGEAVSRSTSLDPGDLPLLSQVLQEEDPSRDWQLPTTLKTVEEAIAHLSQT